MNRLIGFLVISLFVLGVADLRQVGSGQTYADIRSAANNASPGDTILVHNGTYAGGQYIADLQGNASAWIAIIAANPGNAVIDGGSQSWHLTEAAYLYVSGFCFQNQTANGMNVDDGATFDTPAHHLIFENCTWQDIQATGNNDLLKMSGVDSFEIRDCRFLNGSAGGSGIDMVGCHWGRIIGNQFVNQGSNAIQAKGGTHHVRIERNFFKDAGERSINLGGSTGLQYFRPVDATYEAAHLQVYSNVFVRSVAPVAYVGSEYVDVANNTIFDPEKWALRILQETVDETRFVKCGNNTFRNNIVYLGNRVSTTCNIGSNTDPGSFQFLNNLWYNFENPSWNGPTGIPVPELNTIIGRDPLFSDTGLDNFTIPANSPAAAKGIFLTDPTLDFLGHGFADPPSIGAHEANPSGIRINRSAPYSTGAGLQCMKVGCAYDILGRRFRTDGLFSGWPHGMLVRNCRALELMVVAQ